MVNVKGNGPIGIDLKRIRARYRSRLSSLIRQIRNGKSIRAVARRLDISHPTMLRIIEKPKQPVSPKLMLKIIRKMRAERARQELRSPSVGYWCADAK
jgi:hypothetical protein